MTALADTRFRRLLTGSSISSLGDSMLFLTLGVWAKDLTGSNAAAGAIFLAEGAPYLVAPFAGQLVDRVSRRRLLVAANVATGVIVLALLAVDSRRDLWVMYVVAVGYGLGSTVITPASAALLKDLLPDRDLAGANAATVTIRQGLRLASPLVGVALYTAFGGASVAVIDAVSFSAAIVSLLAVHIDESPPARRHEPTISGELVAGFAHVWRTPLLRQVTGLASMALLVLGFYESATFAVIAAIGRAPSFFGVLMSVQAAGSIVGGLATGPLIRRIGETRALGLSLSLWSVASVVYLVPRVAASVCALVVFGIAVPLLSVAVATATQRYTPPRLQGRVGAASNMAMSLGQTVSIAIGAALIGVVGYRPLLVTVALVTALAATPALARPAPIPPVTPEISDLGVADPLSRALGAMPEAVQPPT